MRCLIALFMLALSWSVYGQPYQMPAAEKNLEIEIRYLNAAGTVLKLRRIPSMEGEVPSYSVWPLIAWVYTHMEPCWKSASACEIAAITVKTYWRDPVIGSRWNVTGRWCKTNSKGECPMPAFDLVSVPPGESLCIGFNRVTAQWKYPPRMCDIRDL